MKSKIVEIVTWILIMLIFFLANYRIELFEFRNTNINSMKLNVIIYGVIGVVIIIFSFAYRTKYADKHQKDN